MSEFLAIIAGIIFIVWVSVSSTTLFIDANETNKMLNEVCLKNGGIEKSSISLGEWRFKCKDGASFTVNR
jgi:hypothetical protein